MSLQRFKPYPAYKDSGVEWLGEIPAHWEVKRLKICRSCAPRVWGQRSGGAYGSGAASLYPIKDIRDDGRLRDDTFRSTTRGRFHRTLFTDQRRHSLRQESERPSGRRFGTIRLGVSRRTRATSFAPVFICERADSRFVLYFTQSSAYWDWLRSSIIQATIRTLAPSDTQASPSRFPHLRNKAPSPPFSTGRPRGSMRWWRRRSG